MVTFWKFYLCTYSLFSPSYFFLLMLVSAFHIRCFLENLSARVRSIDCAFHHMVIWLSYEIPFGLFSPLLAIVRFSSTNSSIFLPEDLCLAACQCSESQTCKPLIHPHAFTVKLPHHACYLLAQRPLLSLLQISARRGRSSPLGARLLLEQTVGLSSCF